MRSKNIVKFSGLYDVCLMILFLTPLTAKFVIHLLIDLDDRLNLSGHIGEVNSLSLMFINLMALISIAWGLYRFLNPSILCKNIDILSRVLIALLIFIYIVFYNLSTILSVFILIEVLWAFVQFQFAKKLEEIRQ